MPGYCNPNYKCLKLSKYMIYDLLPSNTKLPVSVSQQVVFLVHDGQWPGWPIRRPVPASVAEDGGQCGGGECQSGAQSQAVTGRGVSNISWET